MWKLDLVKDSREKDKIRTTILDESRWPSDTRKVDNEPHQRMSVIGTCHLIIWSRFVRTSAFGRGVAGLEHHG